MWPINWKKRRSRKKLRERIIYLICRRKEKPSGEMATKVNVLLAEYDTLVDIYQRRYSSKFSGKDLFEYNEVLFSANSCAIEGNSFSVNETRELKEHGLNLKLQNK